MTIYKVDTLGQAIRNYAFTFMVGAVAGGYMVIQHLQPPKQNDYRPPALSQLEERAQQYLYDAKQKLKEE